MSNRSESEDRERRRYPGSEGSFREDDRPWREGGYGRGGERSYGGGGRGAPAYAGYGYGGYGGYAGGLGGGYAPYDNSRFDRERSRFESEYGSSYRGLGREPYRGGHSGRGPKGYVRADERIREDVCDRLSWNDEVDATDIGVLVQNGEVTLEGNVDTRHMKRLAEDVAESVPGVLDIHNQLKVRKPFFTELKERITGEEANEHYANTGTKDTAS